VWVDSRNLRGGDKLAPEIEEAIEEAGSFRAVLSPDTVNLPWVWREIQKALEIERRRSGGYRVIPVMLPGIEPSVLGRRLPTDRKPPKAVEAGPMAELLLKLVDPLVETVEGKREAR
jgi:hypothetical protein